MDRHPLTYGSKVLVEYNPNTMSHEISAGSNFTNFANFSAEKKESWLFSPFHDLLNLNLTDDKLHYDRSFLISVQKKLP